jgi:hypothetical protein
MVLYIIRKEISNTNNKLEVKEKMNLIDFNTLEVITMESDEATGIRIHMELEDKLDTYKVVDFMNFLQESFEKLMAQAIDLDAAKLYLEVATDLEAIDIPLVADNITGSFVSANMTGNDADREEPRLDIPEDLRGLVMLANHIMDCVNKELRIPVFNIIIQDKYGVNQTTLIGKDLI